MIPAVFEYHRPSTLQDAIALLGRLGDEAKVLAGGQSLIPLMKLRLASPRHVVDLNEELGMTVVMIEHDMGVVMDISHRVLVLDFGRRIAEGAPAAVLADPQVRRAYLGEDDAPGAQRAPAVATVLS